MRKTRNVPTYIMVNPEHAQFIKDMFLKEEYAALETTEARRAEIFSLLFCADEKDNNNE